MKKPRLVLPLAALGGLVVVVLSLASCGEMESVCPPYEVGSVEGYVKVSGEPLICRLRAKSLEGVSRHDVMAETSTDSSGWYRMDLPEGLYRIDMQVGSNSWLRSSADTVRIASRPRRLDLQKGRVQVALTVPEELEGRSCDLELDGDAHTLKADDVVVEDGRLVFDFPVVSADGYVMELDIGGEGHDLYLPGVVSKDDAHVLYTDGRTKLYTVDLSGFYASVGGRITGAWQAAGWGTPALEIFDADSTSLDRGRCDRDGMFLYETLIPETVRIRIHSGDVSRWLGGETWDEAAVFDLGVPGSITDVEDLGSGIVVDLEGPGYVSFHEPRILVVDEEGREFTQYASWGRAAICNLRPGSYRLRVDGYCTDQVWAPAWFGGGEDAAAAVPIVLGEGELAEVAIALEAGGRIEGTVTGLDDGPYYDVMISLADADGELLCGPYDDGALADDGTFVFQGLASRPYLLCAKVGWDEYLWYPGVAEPADALPIGIVDHGTVAGLVWDLPEPEKGGTP